MTLITQKSQMNTMKKKIIFCLIAVLELCTAFAQTPAGITGPALVFPDSTRITVHGAYNRVDGFHRWIFGENYRKEWAAEVKLPLINIQHACGGLRPIREGGGMETKSMRMRDHTGKEWVIRSVEKVPDKVVPVKLRGTFALAWVDDSYSAQHPFSALVVPPLAEAAGVPHTNPVIGVLVADTALGDFGRAFAGRAVLLEEREPGGRSETTTKLLEDMNRDHDHTIDGAGFLRARMLDVLIGDWDRHADQWRWKATKEGKGKVYSAIPRDRDQVIHVQQGVFPSIASLPWMDPVLGDFNGRLKQLRYSPLFKSGFLSAYPSAQLSHERYTQVVEQFVKSETDGVLEAGLRRLPPEDYRLRHKELLARFRQRRDDIPRLMEFYYRFINRIVDIRTSDKAEHITISDGPGQGMHVVINKAGDTGQKGEVLMDMNYIPSVTREVRLFTMGGNDRITINTSTTPVKLRIVDSTGAKTLNILSSSRTLNLYGYGDSTVFGGDVLRLRSHYNTDTLNLKFMPSDPYNVWMPFITGEINRDDGLLAGLGFRFTGKSGFRKLPFSNRQELMISHSFRTKAFSLNYYGQWTGVMSNTDFTLKVRADAPDNSMNFFGTGNQTFLNKAGNYRIYYRARFNLYEVDPAFRWHTGARSTLSIGPSLQMYTTGSSDNSGRSVSQPGLITTYDSTTFNSDKLHLGLAAAYIDDRRDDKIFPAKGFYFRMQLNAYAGANARSRSFVQFRPELTYYLRADTAGILVFSDRIGGGISIGHYAFYQSMFLGGQGNLLGYLQNRFAGRSMLFNNLQFRLRLANIPGYILPGQLGVTGFYDTGRVWAKGEHSDTWHQGVGGGVYFAPASLTVIQVIAGHSSEGWYPYVSLKFRL